MRFITYPGAKRGSYLVTLSLTAIIITLDTLTKKYNSCLVVMGTHAGFGSWKAAKLADPTL